MKQITQSVRFWSIWLSISFTVNASSLEKQCLVIAIRNQSVSIKFVCLVAYVNVKMVISIISVTIVLLIAHLAE